MVALRYRLSASFQIWRDLSSETLEMTHGSCLFQENSLIVSIWPSWEKRSSGFLPSPFDFSAPILKTSLYKFLFYFSITYIKVKTTMRTVVYDIIKYLSMSQIITFLSSPPEDAKIDPWLGSHSTCITLFLHTKQTKD